jgi:ABC-type sugar transport system ATPase subunit
VDFTELMGKEVIAHMICGEHEFEAIVDPRTDFHVGNQFQVAMNLHNAHIFAQDTEIAIR